MGYGFFDWLGRVIMLVLAGLTTLSIIGAIAAIPSGSPVQTSLGMEPRAWSEPQPPAPPEPVPSEPAPPAPPQTQPQAPAAQPPASTTAIPIPPPPPNPIERWLEAIAYALLAIAGILAFATLLLWRALGHWRRSADALEGSRSGSPR